MKHISVLYISKQLIQALRILRIKEKIQVTISIIILLVGIAGGVATPLLLREIINSISGKTLLTVPTILLFLLISYSISWMIYQVSSTISWVILQNSINKIASHICKKTFSHVLEFDYMSFIRKDTKKSIVAIENAFHYLPSIFSNIMIYALPALIDMVLALIVFLYLYGIFYSTLLIFLFAIFLFCMWFSFIFVQNIDAAYRDKSESLNSYITRTFYNFEIVKIFGTEKYESDKVGEMLTRLENVSRRRFFILDGIQVIQTVACGIFVGIFCIITVYAVSENILSSGDFVLINSYLLEFMTPLTYLGNVLAEVYRSYSNVKNSFEIQNIELQDQKNLKKHIIKNANITFDKVSLSIKNKSLINDASFKIKNKSTISIVGASGSGKSTCLKLALKLVSPTKGKIEIDGQNLEELDSKYLRSQISIVPQETMLVKGTILENIFYGQDKNNINLESKNIKKIIKMARMENFISNLSDGLNTNLDGIQISGGEKQRISIARALARNPKICIFDEPTSALDSKMQSEIINTISQLHGKFTMLIVAHHLPIAQKSDKIIVLRKGKIVEIGTHNELIKNKGYYYRLWKEQDLIEEIQPKNKIKHIIKDMQSS
jgi:ABC-type multidrug transport system fused ATPase/permease subunit